MEHMHLKNPLALAFMGDVVMSLYVREQLLEKDGKVCDLHMQESRRVCARAQSVRFDEIKEGFDEIEQGIASRARNAKHNTVPKNCSLHEYRQATALEAVIGYNWMVGNKERVMDLVGIRNNEK